MTGCLIVETKAKMSLIFDIYNAIKPQPTPPLSQLAYGLCALPMPPQRVETVKTKPPVDMYVIDKNKEEYGFNRATALMQSEGSVGHLTSYDMDALRQSGYWTKGVTKTGRAANSQTETCKAHWHGGKTVKESVAMLGKSDSWVEKRYGNFSSALSLEKPQEPI